VKTVPKHKARYEKTQGFQVDFSHGTVKTGVTGRKKWRNLRINIIIKNVKTGMGE
jgi:hypothetical protein